MPQYQAPLREIRYVLHEVLDASAHYRGLGREDVGQELIDSVLEECARFSENVIAPTNEAGDRIGVRREPDGASGSLARTRCTMFSVRSCSPLVMKILVPLTR